MKACANHGGGLSDSGEHCPTCSSDDRRFRGYTRDEDMPFKKGDRVRIPKGTKIRSTHPSRYEYEAKRSYSVTIHHFGCGQSMLIGYSRGDERVARRVRSEDTMRLVRLYGTDDPEKLVRHPDAKVENGAVYIPTSNPTIIWPGVGGYWCEVDINDLVKP